ncbi:hypothetical protein [Acetobacterium bakii]|uniref:DUF4860 domain-containing protein n=1 Tax=Acetobacterium bakii TaxID=52689 RepID=A0A0L6U459_9FIRM|nr:hypothetical protein [Acetobacterium bakii]KNZ43122.1 hypothetical protein AKG39_02940 [Acetobacterium bakii]
MNPIKNYEYAPVEKEIPGFSRGFALAVVIILGAVVIIITGLVQGFNQTADYASARVVYLAATAKAIEFTSSGSYAVPVQNDLLPLIGEEINADATISVVDENQDAFIDYIVYTRNGLVTKYIPGDVVVTAEK